MNRTPQILVVDDIGDDVAIVVEAARRSGCEPEIRRAVSDPDCIRWLRASCGNLVTWPSLVLLDIDGHNDDGRDTLVQIKTDVQLHVVPTVLLTPSAYPRDVQFCDDHYANAYRVKSVNHVTHRQTLEQIFAYWINSALQPTQRSEIQ